MNEDSQYDVKGRATAKPRKTALKQDLKDIGRMIMGTGKDNTGKGGRERREAIDKKVRDAGG